MKLKEQQNLLDNVSLEEVSLAEYGLRYFKDELNLGKEVNMCKSPSILYILVTSYINSELRVLGKARVSFTRFLKNF